MRFNIKRTAGQGVTFEIDGGRAGSPWRSWSPFAMPDSLYRRAARIVIEGLLAENRALRHNKQAAMPAHLILMPRPRYRRVVESVLMRLGKGE